MYPILYCFSKWVLNVEKLNIKAAKMAENQVTSVPQFKVYSCIGERLHNNTELEDYW